MGMGAKCVLSFFPLGLSRLLKADDSREPQEKIQYQDNQNSTGLQFLGLRG